QRLLVTICHTERDPERELEYFRMLQAHRASVVIIAGSGLRNDRYRAGITARARSFQANGGRVVAIGTPTIDVDSVRVDNVASAKQLASHLVHLGHRDIGVLAGPKDVESTIERVEGLRDVIERAGGTVKVHYGAPTREAAYAGAKQLLNPRTGLTALVGTADQLAIGAISRLDHIGLSVPNDVAVAGFNDITIAADAHPPLTTIRLPLQTMGRAAMELALQPKSDREPLIRMLDTELIVRRSTAAARP